MNSLAKSAVLLASSVFVFSQLALAAELDPAYINKFGRGVILPSDKGMPAKDKCDMNQFDYRGGKFFIKGGAGANLELRSMLKDGKTYGYFIEELKKKESGKMNTYEKDRSLWYFWVSHDEDGKKISTRWPQKLSDFPEWPALGEVGFNTTGLENWDGSSCKWTNVLQDGANGIGIKTWLEKAKPGYMMYIVQTVGFTRQVPEGKYWDETTSSWKIPSEDVYTEPLAAVTIEIK